METENEVMTDEKANDIIEMYQSLGWMLTAFSPALFDKFWVKDDGYSLSKFKSNTDRLTKDQNNHFSHEKKVIFLTVAQTFIKKMTNIINTLVILKCIFYIKPKRPLKKFMTAPWI